MLSSIATLPAAYKSATLRPKSEQKKFADFQSRAEKFLEAPNSGFGFTRGDVTKANNLLEEALSFQDLSEQQLKKKKELVAKLEAARDELVPSDAPTQEEKTYSVSEDEKKNEQQQQSASQDAALVGEDFYDFFPIEK